MHGLTLLQRKMSSRVGKDMVGLDTPPRFLWYNLGLLHGASHVVVSFKKGGWRRFNWKTARY